VAGADGAAEITLARAAAQARAAAVDVKSLRRVADDAGGARELSPRARRYLIEIYLAAGAPDKALAVVRAADLGTASYVEKFKVVKGTAKSIAFYDLALLTDLAQLYRELARRQLEQAAADERVKPSAEYYLAEALNGLGSDDEALTFLQAFLAQPQAPAQYRERARARQALIAHRQGRVAEAESTWTAMAESSSDPEVLADIVLGCADAQAQCAKVLARVAQVAEAGDGRRYQRVNFALGSYYLRKKEYARAVAYMEAGRDKSNKNKIEANDPEMLAALAEAYFRTKKFSEGLEIFFAMSEEFPVVRQIQEAVQGVYSMEQRSAGDVRIL
jgi:tetratricopeptide (TPR) repeat protein